MATSQYESYMPNYVDMKFNAIVDGAPSNLNTLKKISETINALDDTVSTKADKTDTDTALALKASLLSPAFIGAPTAPTLPSYNNSNQLATTSFVADKFSLFQGQVIDPLQATVNQKAPLINPSFEGLVTTPTPSPFSDSAQVATTAYVHDKFTRFQDEVIDVMQADIDSRTRVLDLSLKQDVILDNSLPIAKVQNLQST